MENCEHCGQEMALDNPYYLGQKLTADGWRHSWDSFADAKDGEQFSVNGVGVVTVVAKSTQFGEDQGEDMRPAFIIFEIGGQFYRKNGFADSYGEVSWNGGFTHAVKKTVIKEEWS